MAVIGGGGLLYETEHQQTRSPMGLWKMRVFFLKLFRKKIIYLSLGIDVKNETLSMLRWMLAGSTIQLSVRNPELVPELESHDISATYVPDPVFGLSKPRVTRTGNRVGIAVRQGYIPNERRELAYMIEFLQRRDMEVVLIPHSFHPTDPLANDAELLAPRARQYGISIANNLDESLLAYAYVDFMVAMRLHSMIMSICYHIPFVGISYCKKTHALLRRFSYAHALNASEYNQSTFESRFLHCEKHASQIRLDLEIESRTMSSQL